MKTLGMTLIVSACLVAAHKRPAVPPHLKHSFTGAVAFSVHFREKTELKNQYGYLRRIPYNRIDMNVGGGYNLGLYAFVAPRTGLYFFTVDGGSGSGIGCIQLRKNGIWVSENYARKEYSSMTISEPLRLKQGDSVFVAMCNTTYGTINPHLKKTFSGFLMKA